MTAYHMLRNRMLARHLLNTALHQMLHLLNMTYDALGLVLLLLLLLLLLLVLLLIAYFLISLLLGRRK